MTPPMHATAERSDRPSDDLLRAFAGLLEGRPERILSIAAPLQRAGRIIESTVRGDSMGRSLPPGASIRIRLCRREAYAPGEIVAFLNGAHLTVHRLLSCGTEGRRKGMFLARGDARLLPDPPARTDSVLGVVIAVRSGSGWGAPPPLERQRWLRRLSSTAMEKVAFAICLLAPERSSRILNRLYAGIMAAARRFRPRPYRRGSTKLPMASAGGTRSTGPRAPAQPS